MMNTSRIVPAAVFVLYALYTISAAALPYRNLPVFQRTIRSAQPDNLYGTNASVYFNISLAQNNEYQSDTDMTCPASSTRPEQGLNLISTCPWKWNITDLGRDYYPRYIKHAVCVCLKCRHIDAFECEPVPINITVFRNVNGGGQMHLVAEEKQVAVSCTCVGNVETETVNTDPQQPTAEE
ncbi:interleukin-17-4 [Biomphalaria glabrata]|nr:hypothetical protein BgiMline_025386 [Biomphalaria glabrata]KAI8738484.1 hypothetical protein BgiMline_025387 [Biomphalaria glabrata]